MKTPDSFERKSQLEMSGDSAVQLLRFFAQHSIDVIVDGGWSVDALLGEQTRRHNDLDIALQHKDVPKLRALLEECGYREVPRGDSWECNFVLGDDAGHEVDLHSYTFDAEGKHVFGVAYPFESLTGSGVIQGYPVRCITVDWLIKFHSGYPLDEDDYHDVAALCQHFGIALPADFERFTSEGAE